LRETEKPLSDFFIQLQKPGGITAREMYGARGWTLHHLTDAFGHTGVMDGI
jgi:alpha-L-fucosidase 2